MFFCLLLSWLASKHVIILSCQRNICKLVNKKTKTPKYAFRSVSDIPGLIPRIFVTRNKKMKKRKKTQAINHLIENFTILFKSTGISEGTIFNEPSRFCHTNMFRLLKEHRKVRYLPVTHDFLYIQVHQAFEQNLLCSIHNTEK